MVKLQNRKQHLYCFGHWTNVQTLIYVNRKEPYTYLVHRGLVFFVAENQKYKAIEEEKMVLV